MTHPTPLQLDALLNFLETHRDLALGFQRNVQGRTVSRRLWEEITQNLNAMGGSVKSSQQWQKFWADKKYLTKKAAAAARASHQATGGGPSSAPYLTPIELRVMGIMGQGFGGPQTSARVPAFPSLSAQTLPLATDQPSRPPEVMPEGAAPPDDPEAPVIVLAPVPPADRPQPRRHRRRHLATDDSVRSRLFRVEDRRLEQGDQIIQLLAALNNNLTNISNSLNRFFEN